MPHRRWNIRISDILSAISRIQEYTKDYNYHRFSNDLKTIDAVVRNLEIIGEAARNVPEEIVGKHPEIPWRDMADMRNLLSHEYFGINNKIVWKPCRTICLF